MRSRQKCEGVGVAFLLPSEKRVAPLSTSLIAERRRFLVSRTAEFWVFPCVIGSGGSRDPELGHHLFHRGRLVELNTGRESGDVSSVTALTRGTRALSDSKHCSEGIKRLTHSSPATETRSDECASLRKAQSI